MNIVDNLEEELWEYRRNYTYEEFPRAIIMHPGTLEDLVTTKTEHGSPLWKLSMDNKGGFSFKGIRIIRSLDVEEGAILIL